LARALEKISTQSFSFLDYVATLLVVGVVIQSLSYVVGRIVGCAFGAGEHWTNKQGPPQAGFGQNRFSFFSLKNEAGLLPWLQQVMIAATRGRSDPELWARAPLILVQTLRKQLRPAAKTRFLRSQFSNDVKVVSGPFFSSTARAHA